MSRRRRARRPAPTTDKRPPEVRLEAMVREPNVERGRRMLKRIRDDLGANPDPAPWLNAARTIWERLLISEDSWLYLVELFTECLEEHGFRHDPELVRISSEMEAIERAHGLGEDQYWRLHEAPADWKELETAGNVRADDIVNAYLRDSGHADVADLREKHRDELDGRITKGRTDLWGADVEWDDNFE